MLSSVPDLVRLAPFAVFFAVAVTIWFVAGALCNRQNKAEARLERLRETSGGAGGGQRGLNVVSGVFSEWLAKASPQLARPLQPKDDQQAGQLQQRLSHAGFRAERAPAVFLTLKVLCALAGLLLVGGPLLLAMGASSAMLLRVAAVSGSLFFLPDMVLYFLTSRRKQAIFLSLPDAIDLMVVCVEAGLGLDQALRKIAEEMRLIYPILAAEFNTTNLQLQMGTPRVHALRELGQRNGEDDLRGLAAVLVQSSKFGSGVGHALRIHSDSMRTRRRQLAEEKATKTAVKLIFPLVLFIFPAIFVVLVGPAAISIVRTLMPALDV
jgi:tight adherence protein C